MSQQTLSRRLFLQQLVAANGAIGAGGTGCDT